MEQQIRRKSRAKSLCVVPHLEESRTELKRTLRLHETGTTATLVVMWCMCIVLAFGAIVTLYQSFGPAGAASNVGLPSFASVSVCMAAWAVCCNYLWKSYQSGLQDIRNLYRQLKALEYTSEELTRSVSADEADSAEEHPATTIPLEGSKLRAQRPSADDRAPSVVQLDSYRR